MLKTLKKSMYVLVGVVLGIALIGCKSQFLVTSGIKSDVSVFTRSSHSDDGYVAIANADDFQLIRDDLDGHFVLSADIRLEEDFVPIGDASAPFEGSFSGDGHIISNLKISTTPYAGLFGTIGTNGSVNDLILIPATGTEENPSIEGSNYIGTLAGVNYGTLRKIAVEGGVVRGSNIVGGLVGENHGTISASYVRVGVLGVGASAAAGGLAGTNYGTIDSSYTYNSYVLSNEGTAYVGGMVGYNNGTIKYSYADSAVGGVFRVGSFVGRNDSNGTILSSYFDGSRGHHPAIAREIGTADVVAYYTIDEIVRSSDSSGGERIRRDHFRDWTFDSQSAVWHWVGNGQWPDFVGQIDPVGPVDFANSSLWHTRTYDELAFKATRDSYSKPIPAQLDAGVRFIEYDIHDNDIENNHDYSLGYDWPGQKVHHNDGNPGSNDLFPWLSLIDTWSDANPEHAPITLLLDLRDNLTDNGDFAHGDLTFLNYQLYKAFGEKLYVPFVPPAGVANPWPKAEDLKGKIIIVLSGHEGTRVEYVNTVTGEQPYGTIDDSGRVIMVYENGNSLHYWTGQKREDGTVIFIERARYGSGANPSISLNNRGVVVATHESDGNLYYRIGQLEDDLRLVWQTEDIEYLTDASYPRIGLNDAGLVVAGYKQSAFYARPGRLASDGRSIDFDSAYLVSDSTGVIPLSLYFETLDGTNLYASYDLPREPAETVAMVFEASTDENSDSLENLGSIVLNKQAPRSEYGVFYVFSQGGQLMYKRSMGLLGGQEIWRVPITNAQVAFVEAQKNKDILGLFPPEEIHGSLRPHLHTYARFFASMSLDNGGLDAINTDNTIPEKLIDLRNRYGLVIRDWKFGESNRERSSWDLPNFPAVDFPLSDWYNTMFESFEYLE